MDLIRIVGVDETDNLDFKDLVKSSPRIELVDAITKFSTALQQVQLVEPDFILFCPRQDGNEFRRIQELSNVCPQSTMMVLANEAESDYVRDCLRAGARDYLLLPIDGAVLCAELEKAYERGARKRKTEHFSVLMDRFTGKPKLAAFISAKGGVGTTTLAVNTAVNLAHRGDKVVLVDLNVDLGGDVDVFLGLTPQHTLADVMTVSQDDLTEVISDYVTWHDSGLAVLCAPEANGAGEQLTPVQLRVVLQALQRNFQYVLVDMPSKIDSYFLSVVEISRVCFVTSELNLTTLMTNRKMMELFHKLDYDSDKFIHILNSSGVKAGVKPADAVRLLKSPVRLSIPYSLTRIERAINKGRPLAKGKGSDGFSKAITQLTQIIVGSVRPLKAERSDTESPAKQGGRKKKHSTPTSVAK